MSKLIAFLRGINVGGRNIKMDRLRAITEDLGLTGVETFIASGNLIFEADGRDPARIEEEIEAHLEATLGYEVATFVRTPAEVASVEEAEPFEATAMAAAGALNIAFIRTPLEAEQRTILSGLETEIDSLRADGREVFWMCAKKQSESKFSNAVFERALGLRATFRGIRTVQRLAKKYPA